ncbi:MAG: BlaI/MecI/CopY family transcriptional regulator [Oscillospiraceae bacterium]|nr:BlaI/MecI/CopY family transcriptional regulator [Oscillospiraceae bacterium]
MRTNIYLTEAEQKLANLIWKKETITSPELVVLAEKELGWKKSTTYTILKKLCDKGVFKNENAKVTVLLTSTEQMTRQSRRYVEDAFGGSLPNFITAFVGAGKLSPEKATELRQLIDALDGDD